MPSSPLGNVVAHWSKLIEGCEASATEFYDAVEKALDRRSVPGLKVSRVMWSEGGLLTPNRQYLRITGRRHLFDLCAAPFGTGFFFSSWVTKKKAQNVLLLLVVFALFTFGIWWMLEHTLQWLWRSSGDFQLLVMPVRWIFSAIVLVPASSLIMLWMIAVLARSGSLEPEVAILAVPFVSWIYERLFAPETYYRIDTMLMFQSAVHAAMLESIDGLVAQKGLRALSEDDRKPIFSQLM